MLNFLPDWLVGCHIHVLAGFECSLLGIDFVYFFLSKILAASCTAYPYVR